MSTLVILGASITALAVARHAHRHRLQPIVIDSEEGPAFDSRWVTPIRVRAEERLDCIASLGGVDSALISTADHWTRLLIAGRSKIDSAFKRVLHPDNETLERCLDKSLFSKWCRESGLPCPASWNPNLESRPTSLKFPLLVRPAHTVHDRQQHKLPKAVEATDESELAHWLQRYQAEGVAPLISESLLNRPLEQYSVPFARWGDRMQMFVARKVRPPATLCQTGTCVEMCVEQKVEQLACRAIEGLHYSGIGEVEILRDVQTGHDYLIEINARPWLQYALAPASGHDFLALVLGLSAAAEDPVRTGKRWISLRDDLFVAFSRSIGLVRYQQLGPLDYFRSVLHSNVFAFFDWHDRRPFWRSLRSR